MSNNYYNQAPFGGMNQFGGTMYGNNFQQQQTVQSTAMRQLLNEQQIKELQQAPQQFSTKLTHNEYLRAICTHKDPHTGAFTLQEMNDGRFHCTICGENFRLIDPSTSKEEIDRICTNFNDLFQTIKAYYGDAPDAFKDYYIMCGFIPKTAYLWDIARKYFERIPIGMNVQDPNNQYGWQLLGNILGGNNMMNSVAPGMGMGNNMMMGGVPGYNNGYPNGMYNGAPAYNGYNPNPGYPQNQMPPQNPVNPGYPNNSNFAPNPNIPVQPQPQAPQPNGGYGMPMPNYVGSPYNNAPAYGAPPQAAANANPVGYVEQPQQDFTTTTQKVAMPGPSLNAGTQQNPVMPEPPKNPNIKDPKATVSKQFK